MKTFRSIALIGAAMVLLPAAAGADALIEKMKSNLMQTRDFKCEAVVNAAFGGGGISDVRVTIYYKRPDKVKVEAREGFAALPEDGLYIGNPVNELLRRYRMKLLGPATLDQKPCTKYRATPIAGSGAPSGEMRLYVHRSQAVPVGVTASSGEGSFTTIFRYQKIKGFHLPAETLVRIPKRGDSPGGSASIKFSNYKINTGLPDSLFVAPRKTDSTGKRR